MTTGGVKPVVRIAEARRRSAAAEFSAAGGLRGYDYLAGDEIDDVVAIGVGEHPAGGERVGEMAGRPASD